MPNYTAKILNNAVGALAANQAIIANTANNISNVNTAGYSRRVVNLETNVGRANQVGINVGNGVTVGSITRVVDSFLENLQRDAGGDRASYETQLDFLKRAETVFDLTGSNQTIGSTISAFFDSVNNLSVNPSSIELRSNVIERANDLITSIKQSYAKMADLQDEADRRLVPEVDTVNNITSEIAELNGLISSRETNSNIAADERDKRNVLLQKLSEKISFDLVEASDGSVTLSLANGFVLVSGVTSREISLTNSPSFATGALPPSLSGGVLNYIVYDYDPTGGDAHIDLTEVLSEGGGTIGGLLAVRGTNDANNTSAFEADGPLVEIASRIEAITRTLLVNVNQTYLGPDRDSGTAGWQPSSGDLNGNVPAVFGLFDFSFGGVKDVDADGYPELSDITSGSIGIDNFSSVLQLAFSDPNRIAAARDASSGPPAAASFPAGDGRNMIALAALESNQINFAIGSYSLSAATFDQVYNEMVGKMSSLSQNAETNYNVARSNYQTASTRREEVSGVSLDEEFTNLIKYQKSFQASARLIKIANDLVDQIVSLL